MIRIGGAIAPWAALLSLFVVDAAAASPELCKYRESAANGEAKSGTAKADSTRVELKTMSPGDGGRIQRDTVLIVDVTYQVRDFKPGTYFLMARFPTTGGSMAPGHREDMPYLQTAKGDAHLCVPLAEVFDSKDVHWPLTVVISLNKDLGGGGSQILTDTRSVAFSSRDMPEGALVRQAVGPTKEYVDALAKAFAYFEQRRALNKVCVARFPEMKKSYSHAYPRWKARYEETIDWINDSQLEEYKGAMGDRADRAQSFMGQVRGEYERQFESFPETELRQMCLNMAEELANEDIDVRTVLGDELRTVRRWQENRPVPMAQ